MAKVPATLPLFAIDGVILPGCSAKLAVKNGLGKRTVEKYLWSKTDWSDTYLGVLTRKPSKHGDRSRNSSGSSSSNSSSSRQYHEIGTVVSVVQVVATSVPKGCFVVSVAGVCRFRLKHLHQDPLHLLGDVEQLDGLRGEALADRGDDDEKLPEFLDQCRDLFLAVLGPSNGSDRRIRVVKQMLDTLSTSRLVDVIGGVVKTSVEERQQILETVELKPRMALVLSLVRRQLEAMKAPGAVALRDGDRSGRATPNSAAPRRGGTLDRLIHSDSGEIEELEQRLKDAKLPEMALRAAAKEMKRLKRMPSVHPEHSVLRNYLELLADMPWSRSSQDHLDIDTARQQLNADHYGLEKAKKRVLEYLAVRKLKSSLRGPILCFVGPPGVGKTSVARSIATSIGRSFHRISLGGVSDEADIRGHRRTYIGSMPGRIISGLRSAGVNNPVFLLDEVDKLTTASIRGDPAAALLEVLDSEQNNSFTDHYLTVPFDLSQVLFIATANTTASIPSALKDRMEVIRISGYNVDEKLHIAERHLVPKQLKEHGIGAGHLIIPRSAMSVVVSNYTREAGVRSLERKIGAVCRAIALELAEEKPIKSAAEQSSYAHTTDGVVGAVLVDAALVSDSSLAAAHSSPMLADGPQLAQPIVVTPDMLEQLLGPREYQREVREQLVTPGVAMGLAWTAAGGELLFVEAISMPGRGKISVTGNLGEVMKESASLALSWIRAHAHLYHLPECVEGTDLMQGRDVHIHFPAGATGKDGPSAGITILTVLISLFSGRCVRSDTAMTGEVALRGRVLAVGGIKEKVLAAHTAGVRRVILPAQNEKDVQEISEDIKRSMQFFFVTTIPEALQAAFEGGFQVRSKL